MAKNDNVEVKNVETVKDEEENNVLVPDQIDDAPKKDETKEEKTETKKEFALIRAAKAVGRGVKKTAQAINGFAHKHPYVSAGISAGLGYATKMAVDRFVGNESDDESFVDVACLPEPEEDYTEPETEYNETETNYEATEPEVND